MAVIGGIVLFLFIATMVWGYFQMGGIFTAIAMIIILAAVVAAGFIIKSRF